MNLQVNCLVQPDSLRLMIGRRMQRFVLVFMSAIAISACTVNATFVKTRGLYV